MNTLLASEQFDAFLVDEASITTFNTFHIDGHIVKDFFNSEEITNMEQGLPEFSLWKDIRPICFQLIKGKKTPSQLKIVLKLSEDNTYSLLESTHSTLSTMDIDGMFLNILFQHDKLTIVCGISYKIFTLDKNLENEFTTSISSLLKGASITCQ